MSLDAFPIAAGAAGAARPKRAAVARSPLEALGAALIRIPPALAFAASAFALLAVALLQVYAAQDDRPNMDYVSFIGAANATVGGMTPEETLAATRAALVDELGAETPGDYSAFAGSLLASPETYAAGYRFHKVKPLYLATLKALNAAGLSWLAAGRMLTGLGYLGLLVVAWRAAAAGRPAFGLATLAAPAALIFLPIFNNLVALVTPDLVLAPLALLSVRLAVIDGRWGAAFALALLCMGLRADAALLVGGLAILYVGSAPLSAMRLARAGLACAAAVGVYFAISAVADPYPLLLHQAYSFALTHGDGAPLAPETLEGWTDPTGLVRRVALQSAYALTGHSGNWGLALFFAAALAGLAAALLRAPREAGWFVVALVAMTGMHLVVPTELNRTVSYAFALTIIGLVRLATTAPETSAPLSQANAPCL